MASVQVDTSGGAQSFAHGRVIAVASGRTWFVYGNGSATKIVYSDDGGATWSTAITLNASSFIPAIVAYQDSGSTWHLHAVYAGGNSLSTPMRFRSLHGTKVTSGAVVIGDWSAELTIDNGGANAGVSYPYIEVSNTTTNPRLWIVAIKCTAGPLAEGRAWFCATGTSADTLGNWSSTNFTNLGSEASSGSGDRAAGVAVSWKVSTVDKLTIIIGDPNGSPIGMKSFTFDPTATTPTPGSATTFGGLASGGFDSWYSVGPMLAVAVKNDYLIVGRRDPSGSSRWDFYKTVNGTSWTSPTGWSNPFTAGRLAIGTDGTDFYMIYGTAFGALNTTDQALAYRKITASTDTIGSATTFSDGNGNPVMVPAVLAAGLLNGVYVRGTSSYTVRSDSVTLGPVTNTKTLTATQAQTPTVGRVINKVLVA